MLDRRRFLVAGMAGLAGLVAWRLIRSSDEDAIIAVLKKRLDYLILDENGLRVFARDLVAHQIIASHKLRMLDFAGPVYTQFSLASRSNTLTRAIRHGEERIVTQYLMSSDFFQNGADETREVHCCRYYDPTRTSSPCDTPFARSIMS